AKIMSFMSDDSTRKLTDDRSFEERVFARFDALEGRFDALESRLDKRFDAVEARIDRLEIRVHALEAKALDTKPISERALAEIVEMKESINDLRRKIDVLGRDVVQVRADQLSLERRMDRLESRPQ